jgi:hypothetical protein
LATTLKELEHLCHLAEYYQGTTQTTVYLRSEFEEAYNKFKKERHLFTAKIVELQEDTLMALTTCKDMERWYERAQQAIERIEYIDAVQQGRDKEEHDIQMLGKSSLDRMKRSTEYWAKMSQEPHREIQEQWAKCEKHWGKNQQSNEGYQTPRVRHPRQLRRLVRHSRIAYQARFIMGRRASEGDRHNARTSAKIYGTSD